MTMKPHLQLCLLLDLEVDHGRGQRTASNHTDQPAAI